MAKPIFIVRLSNLMSQDAVNQALDSLATKGDLAKEYHIITTASNDDETKFEVLNAVHAKDEDIEKIKEQVIESLKQIKDESTTEV